MYSRAPLVYAGGHNGTVVYVYGYMGPLVYMHIPVYSCE